MTNRLLAALGPSTKILLAKSGVHVRLEAGQALRRRDRLPEHVYFPETAVVSLTIPFDVNGSAHVALIGWEGAVGAPGLEPARSWVADALVSIPGVAWRLPYEAVQQWYTSNRQARAVLDRYGEYRSSEAMINAACVALHPVTQRICGTLLKLGDRLGSRCPLTHAGLAFLVGTTRPTITRTVDVLAKAGVVTPSRGGIVISDRASLAARACQCYERATARLARVYELSIEP